VLNTVKVKLNFLVASVVENRVIRPKTLYEAAISRHAFVGNYNAIKWLFVFASSG